MIKKTKETVGELLYGMHPIIEMLKAKNRKLIAIYTTKPEPKGYADIEKLMPKYPVQIQYVARDVLARMAGGTDHQGVVAWVHPLGFRKKMFEPEKYPFLIMLDGIQDPRNMGAIIRSAYCAGASGVVITKRGSAPLNAPAFKASAGLAERIEIYESASAVSAAQELKTAGYNIYLATFDGENATACAFEKPCCIVIGGEGSGISKEILKAGKHVTLPQRTKDISYNASVAAGVLLFLVGTKHKLI